MPSLLNRLKQKHAASQRVNYNSSFIKTPGTNDTIADWDLRWYNVPIAQVYENMREFEQAHECDTSAKDIYTGDDAFPDSFNHADWLYNQQVSQEELEWERTKSNRKETKSLWDKIRNYQLTPTSSHRA